MLKEEDLVGTWRIIKTNIKDSSGDKQSEVDNINSKYEVTYNANGSYEEINNGIVAKRFSNFYGNYTIDGDNLRMSVKSFSFKRSYKIIYVSRDKSQIILSPCDTLYCSIYSNIEDIVIKKI